jgi:hypothetical protein
MNSASLRFASGIMGIRSKKDPIEWFLFPRTHDSCIPVFHHSISKAKGYENGFDFNTF